MLVALSNYGLQTERCVSQMQPIENKFSASSIKTLVIFGGNSE